MHIASVGIDLGKTTFHLVALDGSATFALRYRTRPPLPPGLSGTCALRCSLYGSASHHRGRTDSGPPLAIGRYWRLLVIYSDLSPVKGLHLECPPVGRTGRHLQLL